MKFMQRSVLRIEREQNNDELQKIIDEEHWVLDLPQYKKKDEVFVSGQSFAFCEQLLPGRQSFRGFNPEIEKLMKIHDAEQEAKKIDEAESKNAISDKEMAKRYTSLMGTLAKKMATKRSRREAEDSEPAAKRKFIKPSADD